MTIGVYRVFMSHSWAADDAGARLLRELDEIPEFLYRVDAVEPEALASDVPAEHRRAAMRVAMTQSHVALFLTGSSGTDANLLAEELALAREGFRRRIPILSVTLPSADASSEPATDRVLAWDAAAIACAIQELAEESRAAHRRLAASVDARAKEPLSSPGAPPCVAPLKAAHFNDTSPRPLPVAEITDALNRLRLHKAMRGPQQH
jgi:hypothetical protein